MARVVCTCTSTKYISYLGSFIWPQHSECASACELSSMHIHIAKIRIFSLDRKKQKKITISETHIHRSM